MEEKNLRVTIDGVLFICKGLQGASVELSSEDFPWASTEVFKELDDFRLTGKTKANLKMSSKMLCAASHIGDHDTALYFAEYIDCLRAFRYPET